MTDTSPDPHAPYRHLAEMDERVHALEARVAYYERRTVGLNCEVRARDAEVARLTEALAEAERMRDHHETTANTLAARLGDMLAEEPTPGPD